MSGARAIDLAMGRADKASTSSLVRAGDEVVNTTGDDSVPADPEAVAERGEVTDAAAALSVLESPDSKQALVMQRNRKAKALLMSKNRIRSLIRTVILTNKEVRDGT